MVSAANTCLDIWRLPAGFDMDDSSSLVATITAAYRHTSRRLLDVLTVRYGFMGHLKAMRRYLLLGQGDFIQHLIDLLE